MRSAPLVPKVPPVCGTPASPTAAALLARQAIFDSEQAVYAYELLYRGSASATEALISDPDEACRQTIVSALCDIGVENLVGSALAFVNLSEGVLLSGELAVLPARSVVIEVLEDVPASDAIRAILQAQRQRGFRIALDDFELDGPSAGLADLADIIKVDVLGKSDAEVAAIVERLRATTDAKLLAEKVETHQEYEYYRELAFDYFQGFFLCRPQIVSKARVPRYKTAVLQLLVALEDADMPLPELERLVMRDASLSYKLLRLLNSSMMGLRCQVTSVGHAMVLIGRRRLKRWVTLIALSGFDDGPEELLTLAMIRARMCESLAESHGEKNTDAHFTVGLFSALDAMSGQSMEQLLEELPIGLEIREALLSGRGPLGQLLGAVLAHERGQWQDSCERGFTPSELTRSYLEALRWADETRRSM